MTALDGDGWQLRACLGDEWAWHVGPAEVWDAAGWMPARVPGSVLHDLWCAGEVPDPYRERNSLLLEWVPERAWLLRRRFTTERLVGSERAVLHFDGVDHAATVFLDGEEVGRHEGAFRAFEVDVTERVGGGGLHLLAVVIHPAPESEPQVGITSRVRVHKSRMGYGWDFCPRMIHQGIWKSVSLRVDDPLHRVAAGATLGPELVDGLVEADVELDGGERCDGRLVLTLLEGERTIGRDERKVELGRGGQVGLRLEVKRPRPWWPNGLGPQSLYTARIELERDGGPTVWRSFDVGFRNVELVPNEGAPRDALPYTIAVNGVRLYVNGWNWVPVDALYGVPRPAKLAHLLDLAARANVNLLRVWGGGLIETESFYRLCDRLGLMVWQEFSMSSSGLESVPSADPEFIRLMTDEARQIVPSRRHHPSLTLWCGGNELADGERPLDERAPVLGALRNVVRELDPARAWLPTSPSGPRFLNRLDLIELDPDGQHDVHGPWEHQGLRRQYELYDAGSSLLHSEFGVEGMTNRRALDSLIPPERRWPADRSNPVYDHLGAWWNNAPLVQEAFGGRLRDVETMRRASQLLQYDGLRYAVEANRRRAFHSSGTIPWQFNESYPTAWCTAAVEYHGDPKLAYHGVRSAYSAPHVSASFDRCAWAGEDLVRATVWAWDGPNRDPVPGRVPLPDPISVTARIVDAAGRVAAEAAWSLPSLDAVPVRAGEIQALSSSLTTDVFLLDLRLYAGGGAVESRNRYLMSRTSDLSPLLDLEAATVEAHVERRADAWTIHLHHTAGPAAPGLVLEDGRPAGSPGWALFGDNPVDLLPGESCAVDVLWRGAEEDGRAVVLGGWNLGTRRVD